MLNDKSSAAALLATRRSGKAREMGSPGPDTAQIDTILQAATRVPDHGKLCPWRFVLVEAEARADFCAILTAEQLRENPGATAAQLDATRQFAHYAPTLIILLSTPVVPHKIPLEEQRWSAGAAAMQMLNSAHAQGFVANWLTGWMAHSREVRHALGATGEEDRIVGYIFIGSALAPLEDRPRPALNDVVRTFAQRGPAT